MILKNLLYVLKINHIFIFNLKIFVNFLLKQSMNLNYRKIRKFNQY
jgi:hypothetical protein